MDEQLAKNLVSLIDETISEIEDLKKSRFSAAEIKIDGPGEGIAGKSSNGDIEKKEDPETEADDDEDDEDEDEEAEMKKKEKEEIEKAEKKQIGVNVEKCEMKKAEDEKKEDKEAKKEEKKEEKSEMKKSMDDMESLMKSYIDEKVGSLTTKLDSLTKLIETIGNAPVSRKGVDSLVPLNKSAEIEPLNKSEVASKLFELKKSGTSVDSADIAAAETGGDLRSLITKYNIK
jgi:hypothetical protein